ncbi:hypothetical protein G6O69_24330 [Pseudenhygromyxa sp. WMMC2535]|uniref:hypothetical protein n=1 Tax=Pseudenhygromyxa sp. WMMC2535 TaxID=2712867 RepID=UPI00155627CE|nr:hypothetical protein [Pseudenhygromyxa sp. WMMC2535]NVB40990.1 hypothetical protein [Pseudenhygromyxa sp. WMMC2535]
MASTKSDSKSPIRTDVSKLKAGDYLSETQYYKVKEVLDGKIALENERGFGITVTNRIIEEGMYSSGQFNDTVTLSRTALCEVLEGAGDSIFTVNFNKQAKEKEVVDEILGAVDELGSDPDPKVLTKRIKAAVKKGVSGQVRTLIGYLVQTEAKMGRSQVIDLEAPGKHRYRLVDHRTINWLVLKNVKYVVKK